MKKITILFLSFVLAVNFSFAQEDAGFAEGSEEITFAYFGELCSNLTREEEKAQCSKDQIDEYIASLKRPSIIEDNNKKMSVVIYFDLNASGKAENISIKKSSGITALDNIVLEHFKKMPNWQAMTIDGVPFGSPNMNISYKFKAKAK